MKIPFLDKMSSKKFLFALLSLFTASFMLYLGKLPANYYETISISTILTYLSSNVAYRFVSQKFGKWDTNKEQGYTDEDEKEIPSGRPQSRQQEFDYEDVEGEETVYKQQEFVSRYKKPGLQKGKENGNSRDSERMSRRNRRRGGN